MPSSPVSLSVCSQTLRSSGVASFGQAPFRYNEAGATIQRVLVHAKKHALSGLNSAVIPKMWTIKLGSRLRHPVKRPLMHDTSNIA
jgi:hypothetical protein